MYTPSSAAFLRPTRGGGFEYVEYDDNAFPYPQTIGSTAPSITGLGPADENMMKTIFIMPNKSTSPDATLMIVVDEVDPSTDPMTYQYVYVGNINNLPSDVLTEGSIVNDLNTGGTDRPLSAEQGRTLNSHVNYTTCGSGAGDQVKLISDDGFELSTHLRLLVTMTNTNTHATPKFNINNTGIKDVWYNGSVASDTNTWAAGEVLDVYYNGTNYVANTHGGAQFSTGEKVGNVGIDNEPAAGSENLVKSGGTKLYTDKYKLLNEGSLIDTITTTSSAHTDYSLETSLSAGFYIVDANIAVSANLRFKTAGNIIIASQSVNVGKNCFLVFISGIVTKVRINGLGNVIKIYSASGAINDALEYEKRNYPITTGIAPIHTFRLSYPNYTDYDCVLSKGIYVIEAANVDSVTGTVNIRFKDSNGDFIDIIPTPLSVEVGTRKVFMFLLTSDATKIRLGGNGNEYIIYQTEGLLSLILPDFDIKIKQMISTLKGLSDVIEGTDNLLASITSTSGGAYKDYDCELSAGIYKVVVTTSSEVSTISFKNDRGEIITSINPSTDDYVYLPQNVTRIRFAYSSGTKVDIYESKGMLPAVASNVSAISTQTIIKTIGIGAGYDYQDIPSALTAITDASESKIYELRVCSDYKYTLPTQLFESDNATHPDSDTSPDYCAAFFTKSYINIVGWNRRRKIEVIMPDTVTKPDNIVAMHLQGNCTIKNIDFTIKNGRYAIHQESGGSASSIDYHATTILEDSVVTHLGNYNTALQYWNSTFAQANGACHGLTCIYKNVTWVNGYYMHSNANFDAPVTAKFINCKKTLPLNTANIDSGEINVCYVGNNGQGHQVRLHVEGSSLLSIYGRMGMMTSNTLDNPARDIRTQIPILTGAGNAPMVLHSQVIETLSFETLVNNKNVSVVGGTAKSLIYGDDYKVYVGAADAVGVCIGTEAIQYRDGNNNYTLAYRLGDCASENKTLIVDVDGSTEETITFAENFKTNFSTWDDAAIIAYINNQLTSCRAVLNSPYSKFSLPFDDCAEEGYNGGSNTILYGMPLKRDKGTNWIVCESGETPDGIALERINAGEFGLIGYFDKSLYRDLYGLQTTVQNTKVSVGSNGEWVEDNSNPIMIAVYNNVFKSI